MKHFHYIIAGAGCAGLSFLTRLLQTNRFNDKNILLVDKSPKVKNDRTWCFWEKEPGFFEQLVYHSWDKLWFHDIDGSKLHPIHPYRYKMIRSEDFYRYCFSIIDQYPNVTVQYGSIDSVENAADGPVVQIGGETIQADYIFNSILFQPPALSPKQFYLLQHFKGWVIETEQPVFDPSQATLMDFRVSQKHGTTFVYVMPFTATKALVEYTLVSDRLLEPGEYEKGLSDYLQKFLMISQYNICDHEFGVIPMTNYRFHPVSGKIIHLGTAGGQTRPSSGYTFQFIQKRSDELVSCLVQNRIPQSFSSFKTARAHWYDSVLLRILAQGKLPGHEIFSTLFRRNDAADVLQFLDNETSFLRELKIISVLPKRIFVKAALQQVFGQ